jgi:hypothetical protein
MVSPWQGMTIPIAIADDITSLSVGCNAEGTRLGDLIRLRDNPNPNPQQHRKSMSQILHQSSDRYRRLISISPDNLAVKKVK